MGMNYICGGLNLISQRAKEHAKRAYDGIRRQATDCIKIAANTDFSVEQVSLIKGYIFYDQHEFAGFVRFSPSYEMAESWRRLSGRRGSVQPHNIVLLQHEFLEIQYILQGYNQDNAHTMASAQYDYKRASDEFYARNDFPV